MSQGSYTTFGHLVLITLCQFRKSIGFCYTFRRSVLWIETPWAQAIGSTSLLSLQGHRHRPRATSAAQEELTEHISKSGRTQKCSGPVLTFLLNNQFLYLFLAFSCIQCVQLWRKDLAKINPKAAEALADPAQYPNLFPDLDVALQAEQHQVLPYLYILQLSFVLASSAPLNSCCPMLWLRTSK